MQGKFSIWVWMNFYIFSQFRRGLPQDFLWLHRQRKSELTYVWDGFFYAYLESVLALGKLKIGNVGGKKFYILWQKFYRLVCVCYNQKNVGFWKKSAREVLFVEILFLWTEQKNIYLPRWLIHNFFLLRAEGKAESLHIKPVKNF